MFNNREIASFFWLVILFLYAISKIEFRESFKNLIKIIFSKKIMLSILLFLSYFILDLKILIKFNFWNLSMLKDSIIWFFFTGFTLAFSYISSRDKNCFFKKIIIDNLKIIILYEFILNSYNFSLLGELIFIPFINILIAIKIISQRNEEHSIIKKPILLIESFIGFILIYLSFDNFFVNFDNFTKIQIFKNILLGPILSISFIPIILYFAILIEYETLFMRLDMNKKASFWIKIYAKLSIFNILLFNLNKINRASNMGIYNLMLISTIDDIKEMKKIYKKKLF